MKIAKHSVSIRPTQGWAGLIAFVLLFANGAIAQDTFDNATSYLQVEMQDDLVTLKARNARLRDVLTEIVRQCDLSVESHVPLDARLTLALDRMPLTEVLVRIMRGQSYMLHYAQAANAAGQVNETRRSTLWIFSDDSSDGTGYSLSAVSLAIEILRAQLRSDDIRVRREAIKELRRLDVEEVVGPLSDALADEDRKIRVKAVYALADIGGDNAVAVLAAGLADENAWVRAETAYALGAIGGDTAISILKHALNDADSSVRESAISAFTEIGAAGWSSRKRSCARPMALVRASITSSFTSR